MQVGEKDLQPKVILKCSTLQASVHVGNFEDHTAGGACK